jgi:triacylglycerol lipase
LARYRSTSTNDRVSLKSLGAFGTAAREALAFARQGLLLRHDTEDPVIPEGVEDGDDVVVFLHGLFATAGVLRPFRAAIARQPSIHTAALTYFPGPGVEVIAGKLGELCAAIPAHARLHLVGHSLGGIVSRWFALESNDRRIVQTISMATPFAGVPRAKWLGMASTRDLDRGSPILRRIAIHPRSAEIPHLSIIAGADTLAGSPIANALPGGDVLVLDRRGHNTLLFDEEAMRAVELRIRLQR